MATGAPIVIVGAGRSGTNLLRDMMTSVDGLGTWPCDEINYIWRHGNKRAPVDTFSPDMATPAVRSYIRKRFDRLKHSRGLERVVEKTCANTLRVAFVDAVVPEAQFIHLVRDGRDVCVSAAERWAAPLDIPYLARKARYVPLTDVPYYGGRYLWNRLYALFSGKRRLAVWGPSFDGMRDVFANEPLHVACAIQWQRCVEAADAQLAAVPAERVHTLRYEDLVASPKDELDRLATYLGFDDAARGQLTQAAAAIRPGGAGRWRSVLDADTVDRINSTIGATLDAHGYG